jgi:hypothetical protein
MGSPEGDDGKFAVRVLGDHDDFLQAEPVFVFRGRDMHLPAILYIYETLCLTGNSPMDHCDKIHDARRMVEAWQASYPSSVKVPD